MTTAVAKRNDLTDADIDLIVRSKLPDQFKVEHHRATFDQFVAQCNRTQLDPLHNQIYLLYVGGKYHVMVSIDGARLTAQRSGEYEGQVGPEWCGEDGRWRDSWPKRLGKPTAARVGVLRAGFREPTYGVAHFEEYAGYRKDGKLNSMWSNKPVLMLAKCAEALALRKAFPQELSALYTREEMDQADNEPRNVTPASPPATPAKPKRARKAKAAPKPEVVDVETAPADEPGDVVGDPDNDALKARFEKAVSAYNLTQDRVDQQVMDRFSNFAERVDYLKSQVIAHGDPTDVDGVRLRIKADCHTALADVI